MMTDPRGVLLFHLSVKLNLNIEIHASKTIEQQSWLILLSAAIEAAQRMLTETLGYSKLTTVTAMAEG
jgi:hypothetical protein